MTTACFKKAFYHGESNRIVFIKISTGIIYFYSHANNASRINKQQVILRTDAKI